MGKLKNAIVGGFFTAAGLFAGNEAFAQTVPNGIGEKTDTSSTKIEAKTEIGGTKLKEKNDPLKERGESGEFGVPFHLLSSLTSGEFGLEGVVEHRE